MSAARRSRPHAWLAVLLVALAGSGCGAAPSPDAERAALARAATDRGDIALTFGRLEEAEVEYRAALAEEPGGVAARLGLSRTLAARGEVEAAVASYGRLGALSATALEEVRIGEYCPLRLRAAEAALAEADARRALDHVLAAQAAECDASRHGPLLARVHVAAAEAVEPTDGAAAIEHYRAAIAADPVSVAAWREAARLLRAGGSRREALQLLSEALEQHPDDRALLDAMFELLATPSDDS